MAGIFVSLAASSNDMQMDSTRAVPADLDLLLKSIGLDGLAIGKDLFLELSRSSKSLIEFKELLAAKGLKAKRAQAAVLQRLALTGRLRLATAAEHAVATLIPISWQFHFGFNALNPRGRYRLSRFAYLRRRECGEFILETPRGFSCLYLHHPLCLEILYILSSGARLENIPSGPPEKCRQNGSLLELLLNGGFIEECIDGNCLPEDSDLLCQWEFHDLLFHARSRMGRHNYPVGGQVPFLGRIEPQPAVKPVPLGHRVVLFKPDLAKLTHRDPPFTRVLESRCSVRSQGNPPIDIKTLGEFLFRTARIRSQHHRENFLGSFTSRPYPSGGSLYEIETYLVANNCTGLKRGLYYYDALDHALIHTASPTDDLELLLADARLACRIENANEPQILIMFASRFQRVSWKYRSIAYALMLKNVGVLQATMNLVATAMDLASCIVGAGDSDRFSVVSGIDYYAEGSTGEFILGSSAEPPHQKHAPER